MSTNKTEHYGLHSWVGEDVFLRTEFNENFAKLDDKIKAEAQAAAAGRTTLAEQIKQKADAAAVASLAAQLTGKGELVVGSWSGSSSSKPIINVGKPIKALLLENENSWRGPMTDTRLYGGLILPGKNYRSGMVTITGSQFQINSMDDQYTYWTFYYLAWVES